MRARRGSRWCSSAYSGVPAKLARYIEANGGIFFDDTGDLAQTLDWYEDGDHLSREGRRRYTEQFAARLLQRFP